MIRELHETDIDRVTEIWLDTNLKTHNFIDKEYWKGNFEMVKEMLPKAEVYVYEQESTGEIQGFIGMHDNYIEGIFVWSEVQSKGIGKILLDFVKDFKKTLTLSVYQKNKRAVMFYQRENFKIQSENIDENTREREYIMTWKYV
ncbi:MAG: GNAT family N-acetyltransferase [Lachnospiraceae bacterium]|nr:GNAT family N-acetyltransferase [Lachnospiraceae bacterium]